jgi:5-methylcytosine-specific restriction endonuclease McrA
MKRQLVMFGLERALPKKKRKRPTKKQKEEAKKRRKLREEKAPGEGVTADDRKLVYTFYGRRCMACGKSRGRIVLDHVVPLFEGGKHDPCNLQPLCWACNTKKGTQTIDYRPWPWPY